MKRLNSFAMVGRRARLAGFPDPAALPLPAYREFIDMLFSMALPIAGFSTVFVWIALLVARELGSLLLVILAALGALATIVRLAVLYKHRRASLICDFQELNRVDQFG